ncbi:putative polysaccharide biosynthesis protein [Clostridium frigidicarnis]|uniref:Stage V sporulation protein B n=1 Tax=Clostridium frigidicarnis TaxID=84698 RepID=A0A1I0YM62_9CLOT|nr:polysaccharide biosynthesis protein [Clostridium frigidicarnis]SFB14292.1 stage V sporulation protein B [Clostridium frigidicarnis]
MKKQSLLKGTFILAISGILCKFLGLFFRWPLIMLVGDEGIAYYQISYSVYTFFLGVAAGAPVAISKLIAEKNAVGDRKGVFDVFKTSVYMMLILGVGGSTIMLCLAKTFIKYLNWNPNAYPSLIAIGFAPFFISIITCYRGFFQGMQNMNPSAISQVVEQSGRVVIGIGLAILLLPKGKAYAVGGATLGATAGALFAGIYLSLKYKQEKRKMDVNIKGKSNPAIMEKLLKVAIPISLGSTAGSIMALVDTILVPNLLLKSGMDIMKSIELYGQLSGKAHLLVNIPLTLSVALSISLVPVISSAVISNKRVEFEDKIDTAFKISSVISIPSLMGLFFLAYPILHMLFPGHSDGYEILKYLSISIPFIVFYQTTASILQASGHTYKPLETLLIGCLIKVVVTYILVPMPNINIYGAVIGSIVGYLVPAILNIIVLKRCLNVKIKYYNTLIKPSFASVIMIFIVIFIYKNLLIFGFGSSIACLIGIFLGGIIYVLLIMIFGVFDYSYIKSKFLKEKNV